MLRYLLASFCVSSRWVRVRQKRFAYAGPSYSDQGNEGRKGNQSKYLGRTINSKEGSFGIRKGFFETQRRDESWPKEATPDESARFLDILGLPRKYLD
jgi:hypothetical protein